MRIPGQGEQAYVEKRAGAAGKSVSTTKAGQPSALSASTETSEADIVRQHASELTELRALLAQEPEVRSSVVAEASQKLKAGYYDTPEATEATAGAILRSLL